VLAGFSEGFSTALKLWLFFMMSFFFLGYPVPFCILLGAIGGFAGGWVAAWWKSKDDPKDLEPQPVEEPEIPPRVSGLRLAKQQRDNKTPQRSQGLIKPLSGFFERKGKMSRRSRAAGSYDED
jgi:hypothetical protein